MKKLLIGLLLILVLIGVAGFYLLSNLDSIAARAMASIGTKALGVDVTVGSVELQIREGRGSIRDFQIANPPGYGSGPFLSLGELTLELDSEAGSVKLLRAGAAEIQVESIEGTSNVDVLLGSLSSEPADAEPVEGSEVVDESGAPLSMRIDRIEIEAARAVLVSDERDEPLDLQVNALTLQDLEGTAEEIANQILRQVLSAVKAAVGVALRNSVNEAIEMKKEQVKEDLQNAVDEKKAEAKENLRDRVKKKRGDG